MRLLALLCVVGACGGGDRLDLNDLTTVAAIPLAGTGTAYRVVVDNGYAYVADEDGFESIRLGEGSDAAIAATYAVQPHSAQQNDPLALRDHTLAIGHGSRIELVDVTDPAQPTTISTIDLTGDTGGALVFDDHFLYWGGINIQRADVTDPAHPGEPAVVDSADPATRILAADGLLYASSTRGLSILQRPNEAIDHPSLVPLGHVQIQAAGDLLRVDDLLYGTTGPSGVFWIVDVGNPAAPTIVADTLASDEPGGQFVPYANDQLLVPSLQDLTFDYDLADPRAPTQVKTRLVARGYDSLENWGAARWNDLLLLGNERGFLVLAPTLR